MWPAKVKVDILDYLVLDVLDDHMEPAESIQNMGLHQESPQFLKPKVGWCRIKEFDKNPKWFFLGQGSPSTRKRLSQNIPAWFLDFSYSSPFFFSFSWSPFRADWCYASTSPLSAPCPPWLIQQNLLMFGEILAPLEKGIFLRKKKVIQRNFHFGISMRKETKTGIKGSFKGSPQFLSSSKAFSATPMKFTVNPC